MEEIKSFEERYNAMTPEQQKGLTQTLWVQNQQLAARLQRVQEQMQNQEAFKRLDYLFEVVRIGTFSEVFEDRCKTEIEDLIFGEAEVPTQVEPEKEE